MPLLLTPVKSVRTQTPPKSGYFASVAFAIETAIVDAHASYFTV